MAANDKQIAGSHYKQTAIQPWDYVAANNLGYFEGSAIKYITRWRNKGGVADIQKAIHFLEKLIELESPLLDTVATDPGKFTDPTAQRASMGFPGTSKVAEYARNTNGSSGHAVQSAEFWNELNKVTEQWVMGKQERDTFHGG